MKRNDKGQVLVTMALLLFGLLGITALGIDAGYMYAVRHELQRCADAGALAGASAFREYGKDSNDLTIVFEVMTGRTGTTKQFAEERARDYATRDNVIQSPLDNSEVSVSFPTDNNLMRVRVDVVRTAPLFFARIFGRDNQAISAFAVAEAYAGSKNVECVAPWGIPVPWEDDGNGIYDTGETIHYPEDYPCENVTEAITRWDSNTHTILAGTTRSVRDQYLCQGSLQVLKIGEPGQQTNSGNFFGLDLSGLGCGGNPGANFYYWMITHSCECGLSVGVNNDLTIDTKTGNMVQNTITAVAPASYYLDPDGPTEPLDSYLPHGWKNDPDSLMNQAPSDDWLYTDGGGMPSGGITGIGGPRIVKIPVYDPAITMDSTGKFTFKPISYVGFWIQDVVYKTETDGKELGTVVGRFVRTEGTATGEDTGGTVMNIRLVE